MLRGTKIELRARQESDLAVLDAELYDDVEMHSRAGTRPWRPVAPGSAASPYAVGDPVDHTAKFAVVELASGELAGSAVLWGIDAHNRDAHLGMVLRPACQDRGLATDVTRVLCHYGLRCLVCSGCRWRRSPTMRRCCAPASERDSFGKGTLRRSA
jgi:RimJ/RimL family protein N-acetyltransferase